MAYSTTAQKIDYFSNHDRINELYFEKDRIWVSTEAGLLEVNYKGELLKKHSIANGIGGREIVRVMRDHKGNLILQNNVSHAAIQVYKDGAWQKYNEFKEEKYISLINTNGIKGYLDRGENQFYINIEGGWEVYTYHETNPNVIASMRVKAKVVYDRHGKLWAGHEEGVVRFDSNEEHKLYKLDVDMLGPQALLKDKKDNLWLYDSDGKFWTYDEEKDSWESYLNDTIEDIKGDVGFVDSKQNIWFSNKGAESLYKYDGVKWERIDVPLRTGPREYKRIFTDFVIWGGADLDGNIWLSTTSGNLYKYDGKEWAFFDLSDPKALIRGRFINSTNSVILAQDENLWIGGGDHIIFYDVDTDTIRTFLNIDITEGTNYEMAVVGTERMLERKNGAIYMIPQVGFFAYNKKNNIWTYRYSDKTFDEMYYHEEKKWLDLVTYDGILYRENASGAVAKINLLDGGNPRADKYCGAVIWDKNGDIWASGKDALFYYKEDSLIVFDADNSLIDGEPSYIYEGKDGRIWVETKKGVAVWNGKTWERFDNQNSPLDAYHYYVEGNSRPIAENSKGEFFIRTYDGLFKKEGNQWKSHKNWINSLGNKGSLFFDSKDNMWIVNADKGIYKCKNYDCEQIVKKFKVDRFLGIIEDKRGRIWFFTQYSGIIRYTPN